MYDLGSWGDDRRCRQLQFETAIEQHVACLGGRRLSGQLLAAALADELGATDLDADAMNDVGRCALAAQLNVLRGRSHLVNMNGIRFD